MPGFTLKDLFLLGSVDVPIDECTVGYSTVAGFWPFQELRIVGQDVSHGDTFEAGYLEESNEILGERIINEQPLRAILLDKSEQAPWRVDDDCLYFRFREIAQPHQRYRILKYMAITVATI